jgi:rod shape determining protein RodA
LKPYQKERIVAFLNPSYSPLKINYGVIQSKIAIGSAGFFGKGYGQGTQIQLGFLPAAATDFVYAAFIEEWGGLGGLLVLGAFVLMMLRIVKIGLESHNNIPKLICLGTVIMFLAQFVINVGSTLGLLPVIGVTFPFLSYGGSSILVNAMLIGIIQSIIIRSSFLGSREYS